MIAITLTSDLLFECDNTLACVALDAAAHTTAASAATADRTSARSLHRLRRHLHASCPPHGVKTEDAGSGGPAFSPPRHDSHLLPRGRPCRELRRPRSADGYVRNPACVVAAVTAESDRASAFPAPPRFSRRTNSTVCMAYARDFADQHLSSNHHHDAETFYMI